MDNRCMGLSRDAVRLLQARGEWTWLRVVSPVEVSSFDDLARAAGLKPLGDSWVELSAARATALLASVLHRDLAYSSEMMARDQAESLAQEFIASFGVGTPRCATNSNRLPYQSSCGWSPATEHTFDAGVAVLGDEACGIYWVADED